MWYTGMAITTVPRWAAVIGMMMVQLMNIFQFNFVSCLLIFGLIGLMFAQNEITITFDEIRSRDTE